MTENVVCVCVCHWESKLRRRRRPGLSAIKPTPESGAFLPVQLPAHDGNFKFRTRGRENEDRPSSRLHLNDQKGWPVMKKENMRTQTAPVENIPGVLKVRKYLWIDLRVTMTAKHISQIYVLFSSLAFQDCL